MNTQVNAIAVNRFGLGQTPSNSITLNPQGWLLSQLEQYQVKPSAWATQTSSVLLIEQLADMRAEIKSDKDNDKVAKRSLMRLVKDDYSQAVDARVLSALETQTPFVERLVHFWANHFAISVQKPAIYSLAGAFELEAIRPFVLGQFSYMLLAVEQHPAMLLYLDQARSIGPNSPIAQRAHRRKPEKNIGLNENLARKILELHTLGVQGGYSQQDVTEFAKAMTGWSVAHLEQPKKQTVVNGKHGFQFRPFIHEPGNRLILGKRYSQEGIAQAKAVLLDLALHPSTAQHIATKLARHFVSDEPPANLITQLTNAFLNSRGHLSEVYRVLIQATESWQTADSTSYPVSKFKTPWEWMISSLRGLGVRDLKTLKLAQLLNQLGQPVWNPGSPAGYPDTMAHWASPNALIRRVEVAQRLAAQHQAQDARKLAQQLLFSGVSDASATQIQRAESNTTALALLLVSPEFLRR